MASVGESLLRAGVNPVHPGVIFLKRFLKPKNIEVDNAAARMDVDESLLRRFTLKKERVTDRLADQLALFTGTNRLFWLNMQAARDLADQAAEKK